MNFTITVADGATYDIKGEGFPIASLEIYNEGPGDLYYGDVPPKPLSVVMNYGGGTGQLNVVKPPGRITEGMLVTSSVGASITAGAKVTYTEPLPNGAPISRRVNINPGTVTPQTGATVTFTAPPISATVGIPIRPDNKEIFTGADSNWLSQQGFRLFGGPGGCTVRVRKKFH